MKIEAHIIANTRIAEITGDEIVIKSAEDGLNLLGNVYYQDFDRVIIYEKNITPDFFDLKTGMAGEMLQKFSNYRVRLAIVGDFAKYRDNRIADFMYESNTGKLISFLSSKEEALRKLSDGNS